MNRDKAQPELHRSQSERFIAKARELGLDEREESFDAALTKVARHKEGVREFNLNGEGAKKAVRKVGE